MKKLLLFIITIIILISGIFIFKSNDNIDAEEIETVEKKSETKIKNDTKIKVDIKGYVLNPNVYEVDEDARIIDIINIAGGLIDGADTSSINLSKKLKDEDVIIIYQKSDEINTLEEYQQQIDYCSKDNNDGCVKEVVTFNQENSYNENELSNTLININTASLQQLMSLSGIGESKAQNIIKYREEIGTFNSIEDIKNVNGIGDSLFEKIKDNITV